MQFLSAFILLIYNLASLPIHASEDLPVWANVSQCNELEKIIKNGHAEIIGHLNALEKVQEKAKGQCEQVHRGEL